MRIIILIFAILVFTFSFADDLCNEFMNTHKNFNVQLSKTPKLSHHLSLESDTGYYNVILTTFGAVPDKEIPGLIVFNLGAKFELDKEYYRVRSCTNNVLKTTHVGENVFFRVSTVTKIDTPETITDHSQDDSTVTKTDTPETTTDHSQDDSTVMTYDLCNEFNNTHKNFNVELFKVSKSLHHLSLESDTGYYNVTLTSLGAVPNKKIPQSIVFKIGAKFELNKEYYHVKSCKNEVLKTIHDGESVYFRVSTVKKIITDPIHELNESRSPCDILSHGGEYTIQLSDNSKNTLQARIFINHVKSINYFYETLISIVQYNEALLEIGKNRKISILSCKKYLNNNSGLQTKNKFSYDILSVKPEKDVSGYRFSLCGILSVLGEYELLVHKRVLGKLKVLEIPHQSTNNIGNPESRYKFKVQYSSVNFPELILTDGSEYKIESCFENIDNSHILRADRTISDKRVFFDDVKILNQKIDYLINRDKKLEESLEKQYNFAKPIDNDEIMELFKNLGIPIDKEHSHFCRELFYPGKYTIHGDNERVFTIQNIQAQRIYVNNEDNNTTNIFYHFKGKLTPNDSEDKNESFYCQEKENQSFLFIKDKSTDITQNIKFTTIHRMETISQTEWSHDVYSDKLYKIKLRSPRLCFKVTKPGLYNIKTSHNNYVLSVKGIKGLEFAFPLGYVLYFKITDKTNYTKIIKDSENNPGIIGKSLHICRSDENGSSLYDTEYKEALDEDKYLDKYKFKGISALKIFDITPG